MITIRVEGVKELQDGFDRAIGRMKPILTEAIRKSGELTKQNITRKAPVFQSTLKRSITNKPRGLRTEVFVGPGAEKYGFVKEFGRTSKKQPPSSALEKWAAIKLGDSRLAFVVARSIARKGSPAQPFFFPGFKKSIRGIEKLLDNAGSKIIEII